MPELSANHIEIALASATQAFPRWSGRTPAYRAEVLRLAAERLENRAEEVIQQDFPHFFYDSQASSSSSCKFGGDSACELGMEPVRTVLTDLPRSHWVEIVVSRRVAVILRGIV